MKDFKKSLEVKTTKNVDELICTEILKSMKKMYTDLEKNKNKDNEKVVKKQITQVKDRISKIKWIFINFDKCIEFIEPKGVLKNIKVVDKDRMKLLSMLSYASIGSSFLCVQLCRSMIESDISM